MSRASGSPTRLVRICALLICAACPATLPAEDATNEVQAAVSAWAKVRAETVRLESDWEWQRTFMQSTLDALTERAGRLEAKRDELLAKTAAERRDITELAERRQHMETAAAESTAHLRQLGERLSARRAWLPPRLSAALELPYRSLAMEGLSLGERMQHTMAILNRCTLFNRSVSVGEEMVLAEGGTPKLMEVVYWGLARGYALDRAGRSAYVGAPGDKGWAWTPAPELADRVAKLIAIAKDTREPDFVPIPVQVVDPASLTAKR
ncbi:MAG: DUF3450 family protein [Opitutaceae bacterium]